MNRQQLLVLSLLLSMAVNLLAAGVLIGRSGKPPEGPPPPMAWAAQDLPPETRRLVRERMRDQMPKARPLRQEMQGAQRAVRTAVSADDYDAQALSDALAQWREASQDYQQFIHDNLVELSTDLNADERVALLRAAMLRGPGKGQRPRRGPDAP